MVERNTAFYIGDYTRSGGTERVCITVANALAEKSNNKIFILATNNEKEESFFKISSKIKILHLDISNPKQGIFKFISRTNILIKKYNIEVLVAVEVFSLVFLYPTLLYGKIKGQKTKLIAWEHFNFTVNLGKRIRDYLRRLAAKRADAIVVLTKKDREIWESNLNIKNRILNIYNPVAYKTCSTPYNENSKVIIAVGRLTYQKGFDRLIKIWNDYNNKYGIEDWKLQIIGSGKDEQMLKKIIDKFELNDSIQMIPNTDNIEHYYSNAAFLVMTSRFEGMGLVLIEAQAYGLPLIAYDCLAGPSDIISSSSGFLIPDNDTEDFVEKIHILINDVEIRKSMSKGAKQDILKFQESGIIDQWVKLINSL